MANLNHLNVLAWTQFAARYCTTPEEVERRRTGVAPRAKGLT
jgi:hypothetical protein